MVRMVEAFLLAFLFCPISVREGCAGDYALCKFLCHGVCSARLILLAGWLAVWLAGTLVDLLAPLLCTFYG